MSDPHDMDDLGRTLAFEGEVIRSLAEFTPVVRWVALSTRVLVVARTRVEGTWRAYIDAVPGWCHQGEFPAVLASGAKLIEPIARILFPEFKDLPYAQ